MWGIYERPADGSTVAERLTTAEDGRQHFAESWSPDGETLAYTDADFGVADWDVWTFSRATSETSFFAGGEANQFSAAFSPDGRWLAYSTSGELGIEAQPFPATGVVQRIADGVMAPVWTADGDEMLFRSAAGGAGQIAALDVTTASGITFANQRTLPIQGAQAIGGYRDFDITPDGERLIMIYPANVAAPGAAPLARIDVVLNWHQEVLTRVPVP